MRFRPCIDLHAGQVKQIVGSSLRDDGRGLQTNFVSAECAAHYARMYQRDGLTGGHVIMLGPGNEAAAREALQAYPGGLQIGGGIHPGNAAEWLAAGADKVIVTSFLFADNDFSPACLEQLAAAVPRQRLVLDLSCAPVPGGYAVACNRWRTLTSLRLQPETLRMLAAVCSEFLVHAVAVEGKQQGGDLELVRRLADLSPLPVTYAGGLHTVADILAVREAGQGRIDYTVGSALDIFGGQTLRYADLVALDKAER